MLLINFHYNSNSSIFIEFHHYLIGCAVIFVLIYPMTFLLHKQNDIKVKAVEHLVLILASLLTSVIPLLNLFILIIVLALFIEEYWEKRERQKELKMEPETISFETLIRILHSYRNNNSKEFQTFINRAFYNMNILKQKLNETDYKEFLINYEFTFARIESIIEESKKLNKDAQKKVLVNSVEMIDTFINKCEIKFNKEKDIANEIEKTTLERLLRELNE